MQKHSIRSVKGFITATAAILALLTMPLCRVYAEIEGLQEIGGARIDPMDGEQYGWESIYHTKLSNISENAEAETAELIIDADYSSDTVSRSCTIKALNRDITINAGDNDLIVLLDSPVLENTITVVADKGSVTFFVHGELVCRKDSKGIVWHELCDGWIVTEYQHIPISYYGDEDSVIILNDEAVLCGRLMLPCTILDDTSRGAFNIAYISEYNKNVPVICKPSIIGSVLVEKIRNMNEETFYAFCNLNYYSEECNIVKKGDANDDGILDMSDVVLIMQSLANPNKYQFTEKGRLNADMDGNGITVGDAQTIQMLLLGL